LESACGPGLIASDGGARWLGAQRRPDAGEGRIGARRGARSWAGSVTFSVGDATALEIEDESFDGSLTRFSLHHIPAPIERLLADAPPAAQSFRVVGQRRRSALRYQLFRWRRV